MRHSRSHVLSTGFRLITAVAAMVGLAPEVMAAGLTILEFRISPATAGGPESIAAGPDGNLWFTERAGNQIGRITPAGVITEFPIPTSATQPAGIAAGPDGNLWFTEAAGHRIGRITPAGVVTEFPTPTVSSSPSGITAGPDGNLWFTETAASQIGRITPAGVITEFQIPGPVQPFGITAGPDGNLWFTARVVVHPPIGPPLTFGSVGRITPAGAITGYNSATPAASPSNITAGPDGNLWFTAESGSIVRVTPAGAMTPFPVPTANSGLFGITAGPDGNLWFTEVTGNQIGRITPAGDAITEFPVPTTNAGPRGITAGPDGNLWFAELNGVGRVNLAPSVLVSTGTGAGGASHVKLFNVNVPFGVTTPLGSGFLAYDPGFIGGVQATLVRAGSELFIVTGVGSGGGPHIKLFKVTNLSTGAVVPVGTGFFAYDPGFTGGARVAATTDEAGHLLIITGVGAGGGPHVRVFRVTDLATGAIVLVGEFFAYDPGFVGGVNVGAE